MLEDWKRGGLRYKQLKKKVPDRVSPEPLRRFFIAVGGKRVTLGRTGTPLGAGRA